MDLLPPNLAKTLPPLYGTEQVSLRDKIVKVKFFCPWNQWTWFAVEYDPAERLFFGLVRGFETEWGYFNLDELQSIRGPGGLRIERDVHFQPKTMAETVKTERLEGVY